MHKLQTARLALTLLLTAGPLSTFAEDGYFGRQPQGGLQGPTDLPELPSYTRSASSLTQTVSAISTAPGQISEAVAAVTNTGLPNAAVTNAGVTNTAVTNAGVTNNGVTNNGVTNNGVTNNGVTNNGVTNNGVTNNGVTNNGARNTAAGTQPSTTTQPAQTQWQNYSTRPPNPQTVPTNYTNGAAYGAGMGYGPTSYFGSGPGAYGPPVVSAQELTSQGPGLFFRWDRVYFTLNEPDVAVVGDPASAGPTFINGVPIVLVNALDTSFVDDAPEFGDRLEFGVFDKQTSSGWLASVLLLDRTDSVSTPGDMLLADPNGNLQGFYDGNGDMVDDDLDGDRIHGRFGEDLGTPDPFNPGTFFPIFDGIPDTSAPQDNDDLIGWYLPFNELSATSHTDISGFELMRIRDFRRNNSTRRGPGNSFSWLFGVRYIDLDDVFNVVGRGGYLDETRLDTSFENFIIGPQFGGMFRGMTGAVQWGGEFRFLSGVNLIKGRQSGVVGSNAAQTVQDLNAQNGGSFNRPLNLFQQSIHHSTDDESFSGVLEWRLDVAYPVTKFLWLRAGYTGMYLSDIARASGNIVYSLPDFGFANTTNRDGIYVNALTVGLEVSH